MSEELPNIATDYPNCAPCPFSTDTWGRLAVWSLRNRLNHQVTPRERSAALLLGSGGLPFLFGDLLVARAVVADFNEEVIDITLARVAMLPDHQDWRSYGEISFDLSPNMLLQSNPRKEFSQAQKSGLMRDYVVTLEHSKSTEVVGLAGNIIKTAPSLAEQLIANDQELTFVNFTNVADYCAGLDAGYHAGRRMLREQVLDVLPTASDLIIVDSAPNLKPRLYTLATYGVH